MDIILICVGVFSWFFVGWLGFVYWWTTEYDFTSEQAPLSILVSILGPTSWIVGYSIYSGEKVLIKKRDEKEVVP